MRDDNFVFPDYNGGSIVNLMSSISKAFGSNSKYAELGVLPAKDLKKYKNVVLVCIDGLGYNYLVNRRNSFLSQNLEGKITTVGLATTVCAVTCFNTGSATQEHGLPGWFSYFKEVGILSKTFMLKPRINGSTFVEQGVDAKNFFDRKPIYEKLNVKSYVIIDDKIRDSEYNKIYSGRKRIVSYKHKKLNLFFKALERTIKRSNSRKYVFAYWDRFDAKSHKFGFSSNEVLKHFKQIDNKFRKLQKALEGTNTLLVITADHGQMETSKKYLIDLKKHKKLLDCLAVPLSGEPRFAYCYVRPFKTRQFEQYVRNKLAHACQAYKSSELFQRKLFGLFKPHPKFLERIGDYVLVMKKEYIIKDYLEGEDPNYFQLGNHGGLSANEMYVPLIKIEC